MLSELANRGLYVFAKPLAQVLRAPLDNGILDSLIKIVAERFMTSPNLTRKAKDSHQEIAREEVSFGERFRPKNAYGLGQDMWHGNVLCDQDPKILSC